MKSDGWVGTIRGKPRLGDFAERTKAVSERDIALFTEITGDRNPLHYDREVAAKSVFGGLIVQGGVTSGILNRLWRRICLIPEPSSSAWNGSSSKRCTSEM